MKRRRVKVKRPYNSLLQWGLIFGLFGSSVVQVIRTVQLQHRVDEQAEAISALQEVAVSQFMLFKACVERGAQ